LSGTRLTIGDGEASRIIDLAALASTADTSAEPSRPAAHLAGRLPPGQAGPTLPQAPAGICPSPDGAARAPRDADSAVVLEGVGTWDPPTTPLDADGQGTPYAAYGFAAQIAEIEVDLVLGTTKVLEMVAAHDVGRAINPTLVEGQI